MFNTIIRLTHNRLFGILLPIIMATFGIIIFLVALKPLKVDAKIKYDDTSLETGTISSNIEFPESFKPKTISLKESELIPNSSNLTLSWTSSEMDYSTSVAWGDWDADGDLDLAVGNNNLNSFGKTNRVYENDGNGNLSLAWNSEEVERTNSIAWGDWDSDGDLDLAVGNDGFSTDHKDRVYENIGGDLVLAWSSIASDWTASISWGDLDGDGDLDLAVGNVGPDPSLVYENTGGNLIQIWEAGTGNSVAWGDWNGDGDLDLCN